MRHTIGLIAGVSAVALAGVLSVQALTDRGGSAEENTTATVTGAPEVPPEPAVAAVDLPADPMLLSARIGELETALADREAALAALGATVAAREASIAEMSTTLTDRDAELTALRTELAGLRTEMAALTERYAFDIELAAVKSGDATPDLPVPPEAQLPAEAPMTRIIFDTGSASLSPGGQIHAATAAVMLTDVKLGQIRLIGFTDRTGSPARNRVLAEARARAVADFLVDSGVPAGMIETAGMTDAGLPVTTAAGVAEPLNRSVSIIVVPLPTT